MCCNILFHLEPKEMDKQNSMPTIKGHFVILGTILVHCIIGLILAQMKMLVFDPSYKTVEETMKKLFK